jgi:hypothetical protein
LASLLIFFSVLSLVMADPNWHATALSFNPHETVAALELRYALRK